MWWSIVGVGGSCFVTSTDKKTALKCYQVWEDGELRAYCPFSSEATFAHEEEMYALLGEHPNILRCFGLEDIHEGINALRLEYAPLGSVRLYIRDHPEQVPPLATRLQMGLDTARGLAHIHSCNIWHSDISCRNLFLFDDFHVKIGDFGGSLVDGSDWDATIEEADFDLPRRGRTRGECPRIKRELFALGSCLYEIAAWSRLFPGQDEIACDESLAREEFPTLDREGVRPIRDIIYRCWQEEYTCVDEVARDLQTAMEQVGKQDENQN